MTAHPKEAISGELVDDYARWRAALNGARLDTGRHGDEPPCGYYRRASPQGWEAIAIYRDAGRLCCIRNIFGDGSKLHEDEIGEAIFAAEIYLVPYAIYQAVAENGEAWPEIYTTRLRTKDITAGIVWTEDYARKQLPANVETHDEAGNPRAVMGDNNPPEELSPPDALAKKIKDIGLQLADWLKTIGGKPTNQAEADVLGNYANKFRDFENEATAAHKTEKAPHLEICKTIDAKWFAPVRDKASASRSKVLDIIREYTKAEDAKRIEAARTANEAARKASEAQAKTDDAPPAPVAEVVPERAKVSTLRGGGRTGPTWTVTDLPAFVAYLAKMETPPPDLVETCRVLAGRLGRAGVNAPGIELK